jgi:hypothetical protein
LNFEARSSFTIRVRWGMIFTPFFFRSSISFCDCELKPLPDHNLRERENDLIGNFIEQSGSVPDYQFRDSA